uniref:non-specific serine/threonine protein kinase n=1 Tax=Streptomyces sp. NBC_00003 TaxID=2903608 RepID=A0AAU2UW48_9ACTN
MEPGVVLSGRYRLERLLGHGGMGEVWVAHDGGLDRTVAVKIVLRGSDADPGLIARLRREARTAGGLQHPGITVVHDVGEHESRPYFVMELLDGQDFAALLDEHPGGLPVDLAVELVAPVAEALDYAHRQQVVHRDLKPSNLMRLADGGIKVCDFGLALDTRAGGRLTPQGMVLGTPAFMAPELWRAEPANAASDLYALGVTLHTLLAGTPPFPGPTMETLRHQHLTMPPPPLRQLRPDIPAELDGLLQGLLAKNPVDRPSSALHVAQALRTVLGARQTPHTPTLRQEGTARRPSSDGATTLTARRRDIVFGTISILAMLMFAVLAVGGVLIGAKQQDFVDGSWQNNALVGFCVMGAGGAVLGALGGFVGGWWTKPDTLTLDGQGLTVTRQDRQPGSFLVRWDSLERIALDGDGNEAELLAWFSPSHKPKGKWLARNGIAKRRGGSYLLYHSHFFAPQSVKADRLREVLPQYAGHLYVDPDHLPET